MRKSKQNAFAAKNWLLVFAAGVIIALNLGLFILAITALSALGWWSVLIGAGAALLVVCGVMSLRYNDPSFILLGLILPN